MLLATSSPFPQYFDTRDGSPLDAGYLYFGDADQDPESNPVPIFWDADGLIPAAQPVRTLNGYADRNGSPAQVFIDGDYSLMVRDRRNRQVLYAPTAQSYDVAQQVTSLISRLMSTSTSSVGAGMVAFNARITYLSPTIGKALKDRGVSPCDYPYLAKGDDTTDDTAAITQCCAENKHVHFGDASKRFKITDEIPLQDDQVLTGNLAQIRQATANKAIFTYAGAGVVWTDRVRYRGLGNYTHTDMSREVAFRCTGGGRVGAEHCEFLNFGYTPIHLLGGSGLYFDHNLVKGPGAPTLTPVTSSKNYGILADDSCSNIFIGESNDISGHAQGVRIGSLCNQVYVGGDIHDIVGQHGVYGGAGCTNVTVTARVARTSLIGIKWQNDDAVAADGQNIKFIGAQTMDTGSHGFQMTNGTGSTRKMYGASMIGCTSTRAGEDAFNVDNLVDGMLSDCIANTPTREAFSYSNCPGLTIAQPKGRRFGANGIRDLVASPHVTILNPDLADGATSNTVGQRFGIFISDCTELTIRGGKVRDANAKMEYALYLAGGDQTTCTLENFQGLNATGTGGRFVSPATNFRKYSNNVFAGTGGPTTNEPTVPTIAPVAGVLTIPQGAEVVNVSGTAAVTSIGFSGHSGRNVRLIAVAGFTLTNGGNLPIGSNIVLAAGATQVLGCNGANWYK